MRKLIFALITGFILLTFTSCDAYAQAYVSEDGVIYEYSFNNYPVRYINGIPYYYTLYMNEWRWVILPEVYYHHIIHHPYPMRYGHHYITSPNRRPHITHRPHVGGGRPSIHGTSRPSGGHIGSGGGHRRSSGGVGHGHRSGGRGGR